MAFVPTWDLPKQLSFFRFAGPGSAKAKAKMFSSHPAIVKTTTLAPGSVSVPITHQYKYMGSLISDRSMYTQEVSSRVHKTSHASTTAQIFLGLLI